MIPVNKWLSLEEFQQTRPDDGQLLWLSEYGSMTELLMLAGLSPLKVKVEFSAHQIPNPEEQLFLKLAQRRWPFVREVMMYVDNEPWIFGRSIIPNDTINGIGGRLKLLGNKPLGKVLFDDKSTERLFIEVAKISKVHYLYPQNFGPEPPDYLWARRSLFCFRRLPIMVQEVFLPNCPFKLPE